MDGTQTYLVGRRRVAIIDPGPDDATHIADIAEAVRGADATTILLTHDHPDHSAGAPRLAEVVGAEIRGPAGASFVAAPLTSGENVPTDEGDLVAIDTPGHARLHFAFHWPSRGALFAGDLLMGEGDTVWVGEYPGCVADYMRSLERLDRLDLSIAYPAHGPPLERPHEALHRFGSHRRARVRQVADLLAARPDARSSELLEKIYGRDLPTRVRRAAMRSIEAMRLHVEEGGA